MDESGDEETGWRGENIPFLSCFNGEGSCFNGEGMSLGSPSAFHQLCMLLEGGNPSAHLDPGQEDLHRCLQQAHKI